VQSVRSPDAPGKGRDPAAREIDGDPGRSLDNARCFERTFDILSRPLAAELGGSQVRWDNAFIGRPMDRRRGDGLPFEMESLGGDSSSGVSGWAAVELRQLNRTSRDSRREALAWR
jgi:hypothetical protein